MNSTRPLVLALLAIAAATGCTIRRERMLVGEIAQAIQTNPARVDLARLYPAAWDRVCVVPPRRDAVSVDSLLGFHYRRVESLVRRDDVTGLWFVRGRKVVSAVSFPRQQGDFAAAGRAYCLQRAGAVFRADLAAGRGIPVLPLDSSTI